MEKEQTVNSSLSELVDEATKSRQPIYLSRERPKRYDNWREFIVHEDSECAPSVNSFVKEIANFVVDMIRFHSVSNGRGPGRVKYVLKPISYLFEIHDFLESLIQREVSRCRESFVPEDTKEKE